MRQRERERESKSVKSSDFAESSPKSSLDSANRAKFAESDIFELLSQPINSLHTELFATNSCAFLPKLYGIWENAKEIEFESLPKSFVLKTNHDSGGVVLVSDKEAFLNDSHAFKNAIKKLHKHLKTNYYKTSREWHYKDIEARVFAEEMLGEGTQNLAQTSQNLAQNLVFTTKAPTDYKLHCFGGKISHIDTITNRFVKQYEIAMDTRWKQMPFTYQKHPNTLPPKPQNLALMIEIARQICITKYVRVDMYNIDGCVIFGEFTFTPAGGTDVFTPQEWDKYLGDLWK